MVSICHILLRNHSGDEEWAQKRARRKYEIASWGKPAPSFEMTVSIQEYMWAPRLLSETFHDNQLQGNHGLTHKLLLNRAKDLSFLMYSESLSKHRMTLKNVEFSVGHLVQWVRSQCKHLLKLRTSVESPYCRPGAWGRNDEGLYMQQWRNSQSTRDGTLPMLPRFERLRRENHCHEHRRHLNTCHLPSYCRRHPLQVGTVICK